jgi:hypothetical protein
MTGFRLGRPIFVAAALGMSLFCTMVGAVNPASSVW